MTVTRADGRAYDELRPVRITRAFTDVPEGSVLIECGNTRVMCTATFTDTVPRWRKGHCGVLDAAARHRTAHRP